jgi:RNA-directed DNA polymerase
MVLRTPSFYSTFKVKKRSGEYREIDAPRVFLKTVQRYILDCILNSIPPHDSAVGFRRSFSTATGAARHIGHRFVWSIDLTDFFPSIKKEAVTRVFEMIGFPHEGAYFLAGLCCLNGKLPQGAPTSPAIANLVFLEADVQISNLSENQDVTYTRYADDLTFSCEKPLDPMFRTKITELISHYGFAINHRKTRLMGPRCRREVTGLSVNEKLSIVRPLRRKLRAMFHRVGQSPESFIDSKEKLLGYSSWISIYHPIEGRNYRELALLIPSKS